MQRRGLGVGIIAALVAAAPAAAHGPCIRNVQLQPCLAPSSGPSGTRVTIQGTRAERVVWNDPVSQYNTDGNGYRSGRRTAVLAAAPRPRSGVRFRIPRVTPGRYTVVIYDGAEGGTHYTWAFFRVTRR